VSVGAIDGAAFALDAPEHVAAVWGDDARVLWAQGEPLMLCGPDGVGKSTIAQQLMLRRAAVSSDLKLLGRFVTPDVDHRILYLALDRPRQAARSMRRMVREADRRPLGDRLVVWQGPLPFDLVADPLALAAFAVEHAAGTVVVDSLKDVGPSLSDEVTGQAINAAMQNCVQRDVEVLALHHQRKAQGDNKRPRTLADVYGSRWLTAGCGSVIVLWGEAGDPVVELAHLKQPADEVGPLTLLHDNRLGTTTVADALDAVHIVRGHVGPALGAKEVAAVQFKKKEPSRNEVEKARPKLEAGAEAGKPRRLPAEAGEAVSSGR
jgi:replicative DNA helicase